MRRIFVFGSNLGGRHGKGAAYDALHKHGAIYGQGSGLQGDSYAIPTKPKDVRRRLEIPVIKIFVDEFIEFAKAHPDWTFQVTRVGCGFAGYKDSDIAPLFAGAPDNCELPSGWRK